MDYEEKRKQAERALKGINRGKSLAERKETARLTKERKSTQKRRVRARQDWSEYDEDDPFEDFERIHHAPVRQSVAGPGTVDPNLSHDWLVVAVHANRLRVQRKEKQRDAHLGGKPIHGGPPVVGDRIAIQELPLGECRVLSMAERDSVLSRQDPGNKHREKVLAANVDVALITLPPTKDGHLRLGIVERIRIGLQSGGVTPVVVITKVDQHVGPARERLEQDIALLRDSGHECHLTSSMSGEGLEALGERIAGLITVVVGHSGAGKSTLLNALDPDHERDTGGVRESDNRGRHTTTSSSMFAMPGGAWLIDTPGVRQFGLSHVSRDELIDWFPQLVDLARDCPRGCEHGQEHCALTEAAESNPSAKADLVRYSRILEDLGD